MPVYNLFYDNNRGNDANDGLTKDTAKKTLPPIGSLVASPGSRFLLASDSEWNFDVTSADRVVVTGGATWQGTKDNPVTVGRYHYSSQAPDSQYPIIRRNRRIQANEWVYDAPNNAWVWTHPNSMTVGNTCLVRIADSWMASRTDGGLPLASIDGRYHNSGTSLYVYAPSHTNPTDYYGEVLVGPLGSSSMFVFSSRAGWAVIEDLKFMEMGSAMFGYSNSSLNPTGIIMQRCRGYIVSGLSGLSPDVGGDLYRILRYNHIENWGSTVFTGFSGSDSGGLKQHDIHDNYIYDGMHCYSQGAIYVQTRAPGLVTRVFNNHIKKVRYGTPGKIADGCAVYVETAAGNVDVFSNLFEECVVPLYDNSGRKARMYGNVLRNCWAACFVGDGMNVGLTDHLFANNTCEIGDVAVRDALTLPAGLSGVNSWNGLRMYKEPPEQAAMKVDVKNNIFFVKSGFTSPNPAVWAPQVPYTGVVENNCFYGFASVFKQQYSGSGFTGGQDRVHSNTITADPRLSSSFRPLPGSPCIGAGQFIPGVRHMNGQPLRVPADIGAYAYEPPRNRSLTRAY